MPWYSAHILMQMRYRTGPPEPHYIMENIVLLDAANPKEARASAEAYGQRDSNEDNLDFTCDDRPAYWAYAGVRLIVDCDDKDRAPTSGTELTYLEYRVDSPEDLARLLAGKDVRVEFGG